MTIETPWKSLVAVAWLLTGCMPLVDGREYVPLDPAALAAVSAEVDKAAAEDDKDLAAMPSAPGVPAGASGPESPAAPTAAVAAEPPAPAAEPPAAPIVTAVAAAPATAAAPAATAAKRGGLLALFMTSPAEPTPPAMTAVTTQAAADASGKPAEIAKPAEATPADAADAIDDGEVSEADLVGEDEADPAKVAVPKAPFDDGLEHDFVNVYTSRPEAPVETIANLPGVEWSNNIILASRGPDGTDLFDDDTHPFARLVPGVPHQVVEASNGLLLAHAAINVSCIKPNLLNLVRGAERRFGHRAIITSGYRSPPHNRRVRGALHSQHLYCNALDLYMPGVDRDTLARYFYDQPDRGGLGLYCHTKSIHIDTGRRREWRWACRRPG